MKHYEYTEKISDTGKRLVIVYSWKNWNISIAWRIPQFLDMLLEQEYYSEGVFRPDPASYPLVYQPRVPIYYEDDEDDD